VAVELRISVPDDVGACLRSRGDVSAAVTEVVRRALSEARRRRQRLAAQAWRDWPRGRNAEQIEAGRVLIESSNDIALRDSRWP
jgi:hypothetical protein